MKAGWSEIRLKEEVVRSKETETALISRYDDSPNRKWKHTNDKRPVPTSEEVFRPQKSHTGTQGNFIYFILWLSLLRNSLLSLF